MLLMAVFIAWMNTHSSIVREIPSPPPPTIMLTVLMGQQARLGSLVCLGIQQRTLSEHLVTLQRGQNQEPRFLKYSFWQRTQQGSWAASGRRQLVPGQLPGLVAPVAS